MLKADQSSRAGFGGGFRLSLGDGAVDLTGGIGAPRLHFIRRGPTPGEDLLTRQAHAIPAERGCPQFRVDVRGIVVFPMAGQAQQLGHDHLRPVTAAGAGDGGLDRGQARAEVCAVHRMAGKTVGRRAIEQVRAGELAVHRCRIGVLIIRDDDHHRQTLDSGQIHPFVKGPGGRATVPDTGGADRGPQFAGEPARQQTARDDRNHRAEMADHGVESFGRAPAMDVAVVAAHRPFHRAEIGPGAVQQRLAERQPPGHVPDQRPENIAFLQANAQGSTQGLLALAQEYAPLDFAAAVEAREPVLEQAGEQHPAKSPQEDLPPR